MGEFRITVRKRGPYVIEDPVTLVDAAGNAFTTEERTFLCRCGQSSNKPFCDSTHKRVGFFGRLEPLR